MRKEAKKGNDIVKWTVLGLIILAVLFIAFKVFTGNVVNYTTGSNYTNNTKTSVTTTALTCKSKSSIYTSASDCCSGKCVISYFFWLRAKNAYCK